MSLKDEFEEFIRTGKVNSTKRQPGVLIENSFVFIDMRPSRVVEQEQPRPHSSNVIPLRRPRGH